MKLRISPPLVAAAILSGAATAHAVVIATIGQMQSGNEFSGIQGQDGWSYGYWDVTADATPGYDHTTDMTLFPGGAGMGAWSDTQHWTGSAWDFNPVGAGTGNPPWTVITNGSMHPNDSDPGPAHAAVLRYTIESATEPNLIISGFFNNTSPSGDGTTGRIFFNGLEVYSAVTNGTTDNLGGGVFISGISNGDIIDFVVDVGPNPLSPTADGSDGTGYGFTLDTTTIPEPAAACLVSLGIGALLLRRRKR